MPYWTGPQPKTDEKGVILGVMPEAMRTVHRAVKTDKSQEIEVRPSLPRAGTVTRGFVDPRAERGNKSIWGKGISPSNLLRVFSGGESLRLGSEILIG